MLLYKNKYWKILTVNSYKFYKITHLKCCIFLNAQIPSTESILYVAE